VRMTPVKSKGALRRAHVMLRRWEIGLRMREAHGDPDIWLLESKAPAHRSPWSQTRTHPGAVTQAGPGSAVEVVESEARLRVYAVHDYFVGLRTTTGTRSAYSLYVMCRATIEACAFATWVFDPAARPEERLLRGLRLAAEPLRRRLKSLEAMESDATGFWGDDFRSDITSAKNRALVYQHNIERAIQSIHAEHQKADGHASREPSRVPSASQRVREMLCDEMDLPVGKIRIRPGGSPAGHNGIRSIIGELHTQNFPRVRVGIGQPDMKGGQVSHVLNRFADEEASEVANAIQRVADALECLLEENITVAMNRFN